MWRERGRERGNCDKMQQEIRTQKRTKKEDKKETKEEKKMRKKDEKKRKRKKIRTLRIKLIQNPVSQAVFLRLEYFILQVRAISLNYIANHLVIFSEKSKALTHFL